MGEREVITSDYEPRGWIQDNGDILSEEDVSVEVGCECGNSFWIYVPYCLYRCMCGKVYRARISVDREVDE